MKSTKTVLCILMTFLVCASCAKLQHFEENEIDNASAATGNCDCKRGFCEEDETGKSVCKCPPEYGLRGENECRKCHCGKGANCTISSGFFIITTCICPEGYSDKLLRGCKGDCNGEPCKNGGTCKVVGDDIECLCSAPNYGENCERNRCREKCGEAANVKCDGDLTNNDDITCSCEEDTMFYNEDDKTCKDRCKEKCGEAANVKCDGDLTNNDDIKCCCGDDTMFYNENDKTCKDRCKEKCGEAVNVKCDGDLRKDEDIICTCEDNSMFWSKDDKTCKKHCDCKRGFCEEDENGKNVCKCPPEYGLRGENECRRCHCGKGANCTISSGFIIITTCICPEGYSDKWLRGCKGDCSGEPCKNDGICKVVGDDVECMCVPPYYGQNCEKDFMEKLHNKYRQSINGDQEDD